MAKDIHQGVNQNYFQKDEFEKRAEYYHKYKDLPFQIIRIPLTAVQTNYLIPRAGDLVKIVHASSGLANIDIRINSINAEPINFAAYRKVETYFEQLFITNTAQQGEWVDLLVGIKEWFNIDDFFFRLDVLSAGIIVMWSGSIATIPAAYNFCNGANGTPDLRDKFIVGAIQDNAGVAKTNITGALTQSGGAAFHSHPITDPQHFHTEYGHTHNFTGSGHQHSLYVTYDNYVGDTYARISSSSTYTGYAQGTTDTGYASTATVSTGISINNSTVVSVPYFSLAFIRKN